MRRVLFAAILLLTGLLYQTAVAQSADLHGTVVEVSGATVRVELADTITVEPGAKGRIVQERTIGGAVRQIRVALIEVVRVDQNADAPWVARCQVTREELRPAPGDGITFQSVVARLPASDDGRIADLVGTWEYTVTSIGGETSGTIKLTRDGGTLAGIISSPQGEETNLKNLSLDGQSLSFDFDGSQTGQLSVTVTLDGETFEGSVSVPNADSFPIAGERASNEEDTAKTFVIVEERPELIGGMRALQKTRKYPAKAREAGIEGRVFVQFVVDEEGKVRNPSVKRGVHRLLDQAALAAVRQMRFRPGKQDGKAVRVRMSLPVTFRLP